LSGNKIRDLPSPLYAALHAGYRPGSRRLEAQCAHYRANLEGAHNPSADAIGAARLAWRIGESGQGDAETYDLLGRAYAATGRSEDSVKAFQKAETLAPNDVGLQTRLASARMGAGQAESAIVDLERTLELAPTAPQVGEALFFAALATGDLHKAADAIEKVRAAQGDTPVVQNLDGLLKLAQLDTDGAAAKFREVLKKNPDFVPAQINLSRVAAMQGKPLEAEQLLSALLDKNPGSEPALTMLA
jgi:tetratricopeptide (TPR) repeat protein